MLKQLRKILDMLLKLPKKVFSYAMKKPLLVGVIAFGIYMCCGEQLMSSIKQLVNSSTALLPKSAPTDNDDKEMKQAEPEMIDSSMFNESLQHNIKIAGIDAKLEDIVNDTHQ